MKELRELKLPGMVEERRKRESAGSMDSPTINHSHQTSQSSSTMCDTPSPTFSRGQYGFPSTPSSLPSSPTMHDSSDYGSGKRPLTEVKEEPQEKDEDSEMIDSFRHDGDNGDGRYPAKLSSPAWTFDDGEIMRDADDGRDDASLDGEYLRQGHVKRQRPDSSSLSGLASKMGSRMPSFSRKWRSRQVSPSFIIPPLSREPSMSRSRANSTRAPSIASAHHNAAPPTPAASTRHDPFDAAVGQTRDSIIEDEETQDQGKPTTPLLPPLITEHLNRQREETTQSPLQSPSVAEPSASSVINSPLAPPQTPQVPALPSPPLSTKPSTASFHRRPYNIPIVPTSEIPPIAISNPPADKWSDALGHANFTIYPEPYTPKHIDLGACKTLRADWHMARHNFATHLMRVGENAGPTSDIHRLTNEKWAEIDATWKSTIASCVDQLGPQEQVDPVSPQQSGSIGRELAKTPPPLKMPALYGPNSDGKFPKVGDRGIVGPMEVGPIRVEVKEQQARERQEKKKRKLGSYIKDWLNGVRMFGKGQEAD
ncbi:uncharacterized protein KY384_006831 [Bacidia gigantensis]|uniref:uncharacterized protein n=1 Tax=Bacidia gigantensis TaxID=2732470 RepID=UPI001D05588B|nr:uncharacterized protein KY384_006831 [Bacidia gigantensis]KAG8527915.1 hypothetical protein KY384_006831 [Bacidia gigantensis]